MDSENPLGRFLRARRELVRPEDVDILPAGRRRVAGLRREEVALLTGVSTDYYIRLEQGRERHPSAQVVEALARALVLEVDAVVHLHRLARPAPAGAARPRGGTGEPGPAADDGGLAADTGRRPGALSDRTGPQHPGQGPVRRAHPQPGPDAAGLPRPGRASSIPTGSGWRSTPSPGSARRPESTRRTPN
ncbi:hypothetical protein SANTM175S_07700 [Streptomyces antimycoticus]